MTRTMRPREAWPLYLAAGIDRRALMAPFMETLLADTIRLVWSCPSQAPGY